MAKEDKLKALDAAISQIEKQYGKGSIMKLGDPSTSMNVERSVWISRLASEDFQREGSLRFTDRSPVVRRPWHCM